ncbi:MAG: 16S rRNA (guanine(527)-N(7))-methyltransferase RsmG [Agathobacter sp.]|nr:16S rRNA (guanine(527)-N(7))-methyltransferase RsmG [Agathobacter sp.]
MKYNFDHFVIELKKLDIVLSEEQILQFEKYFDMLIEKNKVMNLTAITEFDEVIEKHFLDSINLIRVIDLRAEKRIIDLGTGAGFPGIPLKIAFPNLHIVLADSLNKRIKFLKEVIDELSLENIEAVHGRAEDLAQKQEYREKFDYCVSRAVANLSTLSEYCLPFVKMGGQFISYKSGECEDEINSSKNAIKLLGGKIVNVEKFELGDSNRSFVVINKNVSTPKKYPRKAGLPSKSPL